MATATDTQIIDIEENEFMTNAEYAGVQVMTNPVRQAHVMKIRGDSGEEIGTILADRSSVIGAIQSWDHTARRAALTEAENSVLRHRLERQEIEAKRVINAAEEDAKNAKAEVVRVREENARLKIEVERLKALLDDAHAKSLAQDAALSAMATKADAAMTLESAVQTMREFVVASDGDQRFKKYILRRAITHLQSVSAAVQQQYPASDDITSMPSFVPAWEVERLINEAIHRIEADAAKSKF